VLFRSYPAAAIRQTLSMGRRVASSSSRGVYAGAGMGKLAHGRASPPPCAAGPSGTRSGALPRGDRPGESTQ
jgi:hypothetical protein